MILYINCCVRKESRTKRLAQAVLNRLGDEITEIDLFKEKLSPLDLDTLERRTLLSEKEDFSDKMFDKAKQFASADTIVIAAPYWDMSFPAVLKTYIENIFVIGIVTEYDEKGIPRGLCKANRLIYVTTAGGPYISDFSYGYIRSLANNYFGISKTSLVMAEGLDIIGNDPEEILKIAMKKI